MHVHARRAIVNLRQDPLKITSLESELDKDELGSLDRILNRSRSSLGRRPHSRGTLNPRFWTAPMFHSTLEGRIARTVDRLASTEGSETATKKCRNPDTKSTAGIRLKSNDPFDFLQRKRRVELNIIYNRNPLLLTYYLMPTFFT